MKVYLDNAATTPLDKDVLQEMLPYLTTHFGNPSTLYALGRDAKAAIETARKTIAEILLAQPSEIIFTSGGTEANNMAIKGAVQYLGVQRIISTKIEHHCVGHTLDFLEQFANIEIQYLSINKDGNIDIAELINLINQSNKKTLVTLMHANNEIGTLLDLEKIAAICKQYNVLFHSDTVQTFGHFNINTQQIPVDFLSGSAHKFNGPKGIGFLYMRKQNRVQSFVHGGGQERGFRAGTENVYGIVGLAAAAKKTYQNLENDSISIQKLRQYFKEQLLANFKNIEFNGNQEKYLYTVLSVSFPENNNAATLLFSLDLEGICVSGGSACSSGGNSGSHVINQLQKNTNTTTIRFSFSKNNTKEEVDYVIEKLKKLLE